MGRPKKPLPANQGKSKGNRKGGNPPVANRFKPGQSGNPSGRAKGAVSLTKLVREALAKTEIKKCSSSGKVTVKKLPNGLTVADILADMIVSKAMDGDFRFVFRKSGNRVDGKTEAPEIPVDDYYVDISADDPASKATPEAT